jgi:hypothetical protein
MRIIDSGSIEDARMIEKRHHVLAQVSCIEEVIDAALQMVHRT